MPKHVYFCIALSTDISAGNNSCSFAAMHSAKGKQNWIFSAKPENRNEQPLPNQTVEKMLCDFSRPWITSYLLGSYKY